MRQETDRSDARRQRLMKEVRKDRRRPRGHFVAFATARGIALAAAAAMVEALQGANTSIRPSGVAEAPR
jgi:hypothetical protein